MNKEILIDGIRQIIKHIGIENMSDGKRVVALFADLVPSGKSERNALKHTYDSGAMRIVVSLDGNLQNKEHVVLKAVEILHDHAFMDKQVAKQIVESIMTAIYPEYMHVDNEVAKLETKKQSPLISEHKVQDSHSTAEKKPSFVVVDNVTGQPIDMSRYVMPISNTVAQQHQQAKNSSSNNAANSDMEKSLEFVVQDDGTYGVKAKVKKRDYDVVYEGPPNIIIPETYQGKPVTTLEKNAFAGCQEAKSIVIPSSIHTIKVLAFDNLKMNLLRLDSHNRYFRIEDNCFIENESERLVHGDETSHIPHGIKIIGEWAFSQCYDLRNIQLPSSIMAIEDHAFYSCTRLNKLIIPNGVRRIGRGAFDGCHSLVDITLPDSIVEIGTMAFSNLHQLNVRSLPRKLEYLGSFVFSYYSWKTINIPDTLKKFDEPGFHGDDFLKLRISNTNPYYEVKNLCLCEKQTGRLIGNGSNQSFDIPDGVTVIGNSAFVYQTDLQSIYIPPSVKNIEDGAFKNSKISKVIYGGSLEDWVKISANIPELANVPVDCVLEEDRTNEKLFDFEKHEGKEYSDDYRSYRVFEYYSIGLKQGIDCPSKISIPSRFKGIKVTRIKQAAFKNCTGLESVEIPEGIDTIEGYAFEGCSNLLSISIAQSVRIIGIMAFSRCQKLVQVVLPSNLLKVDGGLFGDCTNLYSITIPRRVTSIEGSALWGCKKIKEIVYCGTKNEWKRIHRAKSKIVKLSRLCLLHSWKARSGKFVVYCTDKRISKLHA